MKSKGRLNAFIYKTSHQKFLGFTWSGWIKNLPLLLVALALLFNWRLNIILLGLALTIAIRLFYWLVGRSGYINFMADPDTNLSPEITPIADNQRIPVYATGVFSVNDREAYLLEKPAEYWRVPMGEHVIMAQQTPGWFLYQFLREDTVEQIRPGYLLFGPQPRQALAIDFLCTWGPEFAQYENLYYVGDGNNRPKRRRTIYFTFENEKDRQSVWHNLLRDIIGGNREES